MLIWGSTGICFKSIQGQQKNLKISQIPKISGIWDIFLFIRETLIKKLFEVKFKDFQIIVIFWKAYKKTGGFSIKKPPVYYILPIFCKRA